MAAGDSQKSDPKSSAYLRVVSDDTRGGDKHHSPTATRNLDPILEVLRRHLPERGRALEIASGTGQHVAAFGQAFPGIAWQPSDPDPAARRSIAAWRAEMGRDNIAAPLKIDVMEERWAQALGPGFDVIVAVNLLHIAPWAATVGLMQGAGVLLAPGGVLAVYGCFKREAKHISPSNVDFDASLRARNPDWGVRDVADVAREAERNGLRLEEVAAMPTNNFTLMFRAG